MGHGNEIFSTGAYVEFEAVLRDANPGLTIFVGNVEGFPEPKRILSEIRNADVKRVTLLPLMVVAGDYAANDMAGNEPDSWKNMFENAGIEVIPVLLVLENWTAGLAYMCNILRRPWLTTDFSLHKESRLRGSGLP